MMLQNCVFVADSGRNRRNYFCVGAAPVENRKLVLSEWSESNRSKIENEESHSSRRWRGHTPVPAYQDRMQTAAADLRQANDLLPAGDFDARRIARGAHHLNSKGSANAARLSGRWRATRYSHRVRRATETGRDRPGVSDRREIYRQLRRFPHSWR